MYRPAYSINLHMHLKVDAENVMQTATMEANGLACVFGPRTSWSPQSETKRPLSLSALPRTIQVFLLVITK